MKESSTYQAIVNEGKREGLREGLRLGAIQQLREMILRYGTHHLGMPSSAVRKKLDDIKELDELKSISERLLNVNDWNELL